MDFDHDDELLDWDMQIDDNFDDALSEDKQNLNKMTKKELQEISKQGKEARSPKNWIQFQSDQKSLERRRGDGDSVTSLDQEVHLNESNRHGTQQLSNEKKSSRENSFSKYISQLEENGLTRFTILDEEENEIEGCDVSPVEFRGTLSTKNSPYKPKSSCFCKCMQYFALAILALGLGILIGYFTRSTISSDVNHVQQVDPVTTASSRFSTVNSTIISNGSSETSTDTEPHLKTFNTTMKQADN